eukprot:621321-Hanusia_phi.AAC.1
MGCGGSRDQRRGRKAGKGGRGGEGEEGREEGRERRGGGGEHTDLEFFFAVFRASVVGAPSVSSH